MRAIELHLPTEFLHVFSQHRPTSEAISHGDGDDRTTHCERCSAPRSLLQREQNMTLPRACTLQFFVSRLQPPTTVCMRVCVCVQCACRRSDLMVYNTPYVHCCCIHILLYCCSCNIIMYVIDFIIITIITHEFEISVPARSAIKWRDVMRHEYEIMLFAGPYKWPLYFIRVPYYSRILGILYAHSSKRTSLSVMGAPPPNLT